MKSTGNRSVDAHSYGDYTSLFIEALSNGQSHLSHKDLPQIGQRYLTTLPSSPGYANLVTLPQPAHILFPSKEIPPLITILLLVRTTSFSVPYI